MPKPRRSQEMMTWTARKRQERRRQAIKHCRIVAIEALGLVLIIATGVMAVLTLYLYAL